MEMSRKSCRVCLVESEFNVSLFGAHCRRTNMAEKIFECLKLAVKESDTLNTICYKCAENIERYYDFIMSVKRSQAQLVQPRGELSVRRHVTSYVREQVIDADYTFSFLDSPVKKEAKPSTPYFSNFSPTVKPRERILWKSDKATDKERNSNCGRSRVRCSGDIFASQSQDEELKPEPDWKLTPDNNILKRIRDKCFGRSNF